MNIQSLKSALRKIDALETELNGLHLLLSEGFDRFPPLSDAEQEIRQSLLHIRDMILKATVSGYLIISSNEQRCLFPVSHLIHTLLMAQLRGPIKFVIFVNEQPHQVLLHEPREQKTRSIKFGNEPIQIKHLQFQAFRTLEDANARFESFDSRLSGQQEILTTSCIVMDWL